MVEFSLVILIFITLIMAIIEFALVVFAASNLVEATRVASRNAIVRTPFCDIFGTGTTAATGCPSVIMSCDPSAPSGPVELEIDDCATYTTPECEMVEEMNRRMHRGDTATYPENSILAGDGKVIVKYSCPSTTVGDPSIVGTFNPIVTVAAQNIQHQTLFLNFSPNDCGSDTLCIVLPDTEASRIGEDMYTEGGS
ncbi:MAG TPA: pilus assembly protein [Ectothiorhodospiraceae bacterium]|nr:pilus assembly protein [Ectothiorhodospiraceae bacterium]